MKKRKIQIFSGLIVVLMLNAPLYWMINTSLMPRYSLRSYPPRFFPLDPQLSTYIAIFRNTDILRWIIVSGIIGLIVVLLSLIISVPGAYSISRYKYKITRGISLFMLVSQMLPSTLLAIPLFIMLKSLHLTTTPTGNTVAVILSHCALVVPFMVWMLKGYFDTIPVEIEQSAWIDGCSSIKTLWIIVLPLARPGIAAASLYSFVLSWNDYVFSRSFLAANKLRWTISLGIAGFKGEFITPWNQVMAVSLLSALPLLFAMIFMQRYFISGLTGGAVK